MFSKETYIQRRVLILDKINQYLNSSEIRNEVDVLITKNGHRVFEEPLPKSVKNVEAYRAVAFD